jgi:hypothetical protein
MGNLTWGKARMTIARKPEKYPEHMRKMPRNTDELHELTKELIEWAQRDDSFFLQQFPISKKISPYLFFKYAEKNKNEDFTNALDFARACCGIRMMMGNHKLEDGVVHRLMPIYDILYREYLEKKEMRTFDLQKQLKVIDNEQKSGSTIIVQMEPAKSDVVPLCKNIIAE